MHYDLPGVQVLSSLELRSFEDFLSRERSGQRMLGLHSAAIPFPEKEPLLTVHHKEMNVSVTEDGWQYFLPNVPQLQVQLLKNREEILCSPIDASWKEQLMLPLLRTAIECVSAFENVLSLHAACVELDGEAVCFTAPSGVGKSTRAMQWEQALGAKLISGDRPSIRLEQNFVSACGVPWDGKEKIYRNVQRPLKMICSIVRSDEVYACKMNKDQARRLLMQQCFIPMWDNDAAVAVLTTIRRLIDRVPVIELHCGPNAESARKAYELIYQHPEKIVEEMKDESKKRICDAYGG